MVHRDKLGRSAFKAALISCVAAQQSFDYDGMATERIPEKVLGYSFSTLNTAVAQTLRLDLDVAEMGVLMSQYNWEAAQKVFEQGGFSADHAELVFGDPFPRNVAMGETVQQGGGWSKTVGLVKAAAQQGATFLAVDYTSIWSPCVGTSITDPMLPGPYSTLQNGSLHCFDARGDVTVGGDMLGVPTSASSHFMSLLQLGKSVTHTPSGYLKLYKAYFDREDFATALAFDALHGAGVFESTGHGQFNADAVKKSVQGLIVWVQVLHQLNLAASKCQQCHDPACRNEALVEWDKAAALYGGSQWNSLLGGYFLLGLASQTCRFFGTCDENGQSKSSLRAIQAFNDGKARLQLGDCELSSVEEALVAQVSTTLFQNLLLNAYEMAQERATSGQANGREYLRGYIFATAVLPLVSYCDPSASEVLHASMVQNQGKDLEFEAIKSSIESVLACMRIECSDLGILSTEGHSVSFCKDSSETETKSEFSGSVSMTLVVVVAIVVCALVALSCCGMYKYAYQRGRYSVFEDGVSVMAATSSRDQSQTDARTIGNDTAA